MTFFMGNSVRQLSCTCPQLLDYHFPKNSLPSMIIIIFCFLLNLNALQFPSYDTQYGIYESVPSFSAALISHLLPLNVSSYNYEGTSKPCGKIENMFISL